MRIADLTLAFLDQHPQALPLDGRADAEVRVWLGGHVAARNLAAGKLDDPSPYAMPDHVLGRGARYSLDEIGDALKTLAAWYSNANAALMGVQQHLAARRLKAPPVRCWPHDFDLDCAVALPRGRTMGIGYSPGDEFCDEPYFYTSMWPEPSIPGLPLLPAMAHWHTYKFLAALAPAHKIVAAHDQGAYVQQFLDVSVAAALTRCVSGATELRSAIRRRPAIFLANLEHRAHGRLLCARELIFVAGGRIWHTSRQVRYDEGAFAVSWGAGLPGRAARR